MRFFILTLPFAASLTIQVNPRSAQGPLSAKTLAEAQDILRSTLTNTRGTDVTIALAKGVHRVPQGGLRLTAADSPSPGFTVAWRGSARDTTSISGGENVTGWTLSTDPTLPAGTFEAPLPAAMVGGGGSRQLYVDGMRATRTSQTSSMALPGLALDVATDCPACSYTMPAGSPLTWSNTGDIEFVYEGVASSWSESRCAVENITSLGNRLEANCSVNPTSEVNCGYPYSTEEQCYANITAAHPQGCCWHPGGVPPTNQWCIAPDYPAVQVNGTLIMMQQPCFWNLVNRPHQPYGGAPPTRVENVREHLAGSPQGTWYLDRARSTVYYLPLPGQDMGDVDAVIAAEESLVALHGAARQSFSDVTFAFATWLRPAQGAGLVDQQGSASNICPYGVVNAAGCGANDVYVVTPGNVDLSNASFIDFANCTFRHLGAFAAAAHGGSQAVSWRGCDFEDVSGGALMLGDTASFNETDPALWDANFTVEDCTMTNVPSEFTGATTIFAAYVADTTIAHNYIANASYSALTLGWGWGREASMHGGNVVIANHIAGAQLDRCCDGGGLYTLGPQPGSALTNNYICEGAIAGAWGPANGNAIYHDNGSGGFTDTGNVIDGNWRQYFFQDDSDGPYGPAPGLCPGLGGAPANCGMAFENNWMRTNAGGTTAHQNTSFANNTQIAPGSPLPPVAAAIAAAAGPRY